MAGFCASSAECTAHIDQMYKKHLSFFWEKTFDTCQGSANFLNEKNVTSFSRSWEKFSILILAKKIKTEQG